MNKLLLFSLVFGCCFILAPARSVDTTDDDDVDDSEAEQNNEASGSETLVHSSSKLKSEKEGGENAEVSDNSEQENPIEEPVKNPSKGKKDNDDEQPGQLPGISSEDNPLPESPAAPAPSNEEESDSEDTNNEKKDDTNQCNLKINRVGCFSKKMKLKTFTTNLQLEKEVPMKKGKIANDEEFNDLLPKIACDCANAALNAGNAVFSIRNIAECWTGPDDTKYDAEGSSRDCISFNEKECEGGDIFCAGKRHADFVYYIDTPDHTKSPEEIQAEWKKGKPQSRAKPKSKGKSKSGKKTKKSKKSKKNKKH